MLTITLCSTLPLCCDLTDKKHFQESPHVLSLWSINIKTRLKYSTCNLMHIRFFHVEVLFDLSLLKEINAMQLMYAWVSTEEIR